MAKTKKRERNAANLALVKYRPVLPLDLPRGGFNRENHRNLLQLERRCPQSTRPASRCKQTRIALLRRFRYVERLDHAERRGLPFFLRHRDGNRIVNRTSRGLVDIDHVRLVEERIDRLEMLEFARVEREWFFVA